MVHKQNEHINTRKNTTHYEHNVQNKTKDCGYFNQTNINIMAKHKKKGNLNTNQDNTFLFDSVDRNN